MTDLLELREEPASPRTRRGRRGFGRFLAVLILLALLVTLVAGAVYAGRKVLGGSAAPDYPGPGSGEVTIQIKPGDNASAIGETLLAKDVVKSRIAFFEVARDDPRSLTLQPGFYQVQEQMSAADALALLLDPASRLVGRVTVPEGLGLKRVLPILAAGTKLPLAEFQAAIKQPALGLPAYANGNAEGFLFPATYDIEPGSTALSVLQQMVRRFEQAATKVDLVAGAAKIGRTPYEVVITASIVEREAIEKDFPRVARVVYNRIEAGMPLQFDSSINYFLDKPKGRLLLDDLKIKSPYNLYLNTGLTPTPISDPGEAALKAALNPTPGDFIYFITIDKAGNSLFTADYNEFLRAKKKAQAENVY